MRLNRDKCDGEGEYRFESRPVFIVGGSRTGSEMLKTMLSASQDLDFVDELFLLCPRWLHKDLAFHIRQHVGDLSSERALDRLMNLLYSGTPYGWFWSVVETELDRDLLREELSKSPLTLQAILTAIMVVHAWERGKFGIGAKFPMHYSSTPTLLEWYPDCRLVHTTRDPRAVYASQVAKYTSPSKGITRNSLISFGQFVHISIQTLWTAYLHRRLRCRSNYLLVRYEDLIMSPQETLGKVCSHLSVSYLPTMLQPRQYGSSFGEIAGGTGISASSLERWRQTLSPMTVIFINLIARRAAATLGYQIA